MASEITLGQACRRKLDIDTAFLVMVCALVA